ncbi:DUF2651 family protein [Aneurinibacillus migulanus]|uniref:DUF2651 domain-containing protein n=1 Tax=Aneurinibacillus migulanus TaxID=47500 RepID=A0A0D1UT57_ANEMI|nr:DUF2651 family protein [Aneurinibacillus migulanus]KIV50119.1 hypothetical protein TS65_30215 [Aneurinibacillus migulanus]KON96149.1 hypothetical protein AF333_12305 [Aneurinibacillus migulanus]MED0894581.1 DUF2651 family protein [Aneurinibacillus migulanus]MED1616277.1 DUF2651 family protein [Aneurinibacillus migulanus]SDI73250.1 Protein of unknown function [Aneurinibacillus migulanus]
MEMILILYIYPIVVIMASIVFYYITRKWYVGPLLTFIILTIMTLTPAFTTAFFNWVIVYTVLSIGVTFISKLFSRKK